MVLFRLLKKKSTEIISFANTLYVITGQFAEILKFGIQFVQLKLFYF